MLQKFLSYSASTKCKACSGRPTAERDDFKNRISGMVSYHKGSKLNLYPTIKIDKIVKLSMSDYQVNQHILARILEKPLELKSNFNRYSYSMDKPKTKKEERFSSYYKLFSRSACNFVYPDHYPNRIPEDVHQPKEVTNRIKLQLISKLTKDASK